MTGKIYCFVDETGQHTEGKSFIVGMVLCDSDVDVARNILTDIERSTNKGNRKWTKSNDGVRKAYMLEIFQQSYFAGKLFYRFSQSSREYFRLTAEAVAAAIHQYRPQHKVTIVVDGLEGGERAQFLKLIRREMIQVDKLRGARDESEPMIRLADALCGFLADSYGGRQEFAGIREEMLRKNVVVQLK